MQATTRFNRSALWLAPAAIALVAVVGCGSAATKTETVSHAVPARPDVIDRVTSRVQVPNRQDSLLTSVLGAKAPSNLPASADAAEAWLLPSNVLPVSGEDPRWVYYRG
jgi:hypothetical protein